MKTLKRNRLLLKILMVIMSMLMLFSVVSFSAFADESAAQEIHGEVVFGSYPQSKVTDSALIETLNQKAGDPEKWECYDFGEKTYFKYVGAFESGGAYGIFTTSSDYMKRIDITVNGEKYRGVYFTLYRYNDTLSEYNGVQKDNGYLKNTVYWFKYEPLHWLAYYKNTYQCTTLIDAGDLGSNTVDFWNEPYLEYKSSVTNEYAPLKDWLNGDFIDTAFTDDEQSKLVASDDVYGLKVNLPGAYNGVYSKVTEPKNCNGTDYAKCMGLGVENGEASYWKTVSPIDSFDVTTGPDNEVVSGYTTSVGICPRITLSDTYSVCKSESQIILGSYPQELVTDTQLIKNLNGNAPAQSSWSIYPYYKNGSKTSDMKYCDITYDNAKYRGIYIKDYRPIRTDRRGDDHNQSNYGYTKGNTYWFKYQPIKWDKLNNSGDYICNSILDAQPFNNVERSSSACTYSYSSYEYGASYVREWLNTIFLTTAFNATELSNIKIQQFYSPTLKKTFNDYVFCVNGSEYSSDTIADQPFTSDYAFSQGLGKFTEGYYWWRSGNTGYRHSSGQSLAKINDIEITVKVDGQKYYGTFFFATSTEVGVRPAIRLKSVNTDDIVTCTHSQLSDWIVEKKATCTTYGRNIKVCRTCGKEIISAITTGTHNFNGTATKSNGDGTHCKVCSVCNKVYGGTKITCSGGTATCSSKAKCSSCGGEYGSFGSHKFTYLKSNGDATCLANGTCTLKCDYCSVTTIKTEPATKKSHSYTGAYIGNGNGYHSRLCVNGCGLADTESLLKCSGGISSCTEVAVCSVCGGEYGPTGHQFKAKQTYKEATCLSDETEQGICIKCKAFVISTVAGTKKVHSYESDIFLSNGDGTHSRMCINGCKKPGGAKYACSGGTATCVARAKCSVCGGEYGDFGDEHNFGNAVVVIAPTCMSEGVQTLTCTRSGCKVTKTESLPKVSHDFTGDYVSTGDGKTHCRKCKYNCGAIGGTAENCSGGTATCQTSAICEICNSPYGSKGTHLYTSYKPKTAATCLSAGTKSRYCHYCGRTQTGTNKDDPIKPHDYSGDWVSNGDGTHSRLCVNGCGLPDPDVKVNCSGGTATCDSRAVCTVCNAGYGTFAHTFGSYKYNNDATCMSAGTKTRVCSKCSLTQKVADEAHPMLSHSYTGAYINNGNGTHSRLCVNGCGLPDATKTNCYGGTATCISKAVCADCKTPYGSFGSHNFVNNADSKYLVSVANCESPAVYCVSCSICGTKSTGVFAYGDKDMSNHTHLDIYGNCSGCGKIGENTQHNTGDCSCNCHKGGISGFIWKILCFFYKLFGIEKNRICDCGISHW